MNGPKSPTRVTPRTSRVAPPRRVTETPVRRAPTDRLAPRTQSIEAPSVTRAPIRRVPGDRLGVADTVRARADDGFSRGISPTQRPAAVGSRFAGSGSYPSISLGFDHGELRYGSIRLDGRDGHGGGGRGASVYGTHGGRRHGSTYGQLYYDHRYRFYGPHRAYWSTAYYPDYTPIYWPSYDYCSPRYGYVFGSVYSGGPRVVNVYDETTYVVETEATEPAEFEAVEEAPYAAAQEVQRPSAQSHGSGGASAPPVAVQDPITEDQGWGPILGEGNLAFSEGRYEDARRVYVRAMLIDERDGYAKMLYAWANFALGDYQLAATAIRRALLTSPDLVRYPIDIRLHYRDLVALEGQVGALQAHVAANPSDREAGLLLGYLFYSIGDLPRGMAAFNDLAAGDATDPTVTALREAAATAAKAELRGN